MCSCGAIKVRYGCKFRESEVSHLRIVPLIKEDITGLDVPMKYRGICFSVEV